ncbi:vWA domain-containing protein [Paenibacillus sp. strain BS8-2]
MDQTVNFQHSWSKSYLPANVTNTVYLLLEARGTVRKTEGRAPLNVSLVLDRSGSMSGAPLVYSKLAAQFVVDQMDQNDLFSLVAFDSQVRTLIPPTKVLHKDLFKEQIQSIQPGGATNLSGGLIEGAQHVMSNKTEGSVNRVILLSDGHANNGITDHHQLGAIAKEYRASEVGVSTLGVGNGFDEDVMETIAEHGGGNFYYIRTAEEIPTIFQQELQGLLNVVAQNMKLQVVPIEGVSITAVYGYPVSRQTDEVSISLGDLYQNDCKSLLVELQLPAYAAGEQQVLQLNWEYVDVTEGASAVNCQIDVAATFTKDLQLLSQEENVKVLQQVELTKSALVIEEAMQAFDSGDMQGGQQLLKKQADKMLHMSVQMSSPLMAEESAKLYEQLNDFEYSSEKRKVLHEEKYRRMKGKKL